MALDFLIKNARIVTLQGIAQGDVCISNGKIVKIGSIDEKADREIDASSKFLLPGAIDIHVHFRDPGFPIKGDFASESAAAAAGGITTVLDMPNTNPPTLTIQALEEKRKLAAAKSLVNFGFFFGLAYDNFQEIENAKNVAGIKVYMGSSTGGLLVQDTDVIGKLFEMRKLVIVHAEDESIIRENERKFRDRAEGERELEPKIHSIIRDRKSAYEAVKTVLHLAKKYDARIHITHISTADEVKEIQKFKSPKVSCDATPHHLALTSAYYERLGNYVKVNPPLRENSDRQALWKGLKSGVIDLVASDHAPHAKAEKEQNYWNASAGVPGVQTLLPFLLDSVEHGDLTLSDVVKLTAANPAKLFDIKNKGKIEVGYDADLVLVDMSLERELIPEMLLYKCGWSPFTGWKFHGWPVLTIVNGMVVYENGKIVSGARGKEVQF